MSASASQSDQRTNNTQTTVQGGSGTTITGVQGNFNDPALQLGTVQALSDVVKAVLAETAGEGADVVCEMSGVPSALHQAFAAVRMGGRVQLLGIPDGMVPMDFANEIIFKGITVYGVIGRKMYQTWHQMRRFLIGGQFDPRPVITHKFPLPKIDDALAAIRSGDAGKVILEIA